MTLSGLSCDLPVASGLAGADPPVETATGYFVTGEIGGVEGGLGQDSSSQERPNDNPCP